MIKNASELKAVQQRWTEFNGALQKLEGYTGDLDPIQIEMQKDSIKSFIEEFEQEIREYNNLKSGRIAIINFQNIHKLHEVVIKTRLAFRMSQQQLADKIGCSQQQIQRWESTNYESIAWSKMLDIIDALGINLNYGYIHIQQATFLPSTEYDIGAITKANEKIRGRQILMVVGEN